MSNLIEHAKRELTLSGVDEDIYGDEVSKAVLALIELFSSQRHSGMSASITIYMFSQLANFKNLTPLTDTPEEWMCHRDPTPEKPGLWQNVRNGTAFSEDGGKTYTYVDDDTREIYVSLDHTKEPETI